MGQSGGGLRRLEMDRSTLLHVLTLLTLVSGDSGHAGGGGGVGSQAPSSGYGSPSSGYGAPSSGYGPPSNGYGAPSTSYGAPSGGSSGYGGATGGVSTGYGAPSSGSSSGYSAPCDSYGCGGGGGSAPSYDSPIYVYQEQPTSAGGSKHGGLGALLPLGGLALLAPLALFGLLTFFPTTAIVPGRKRREASRSMSGSNSSMPSMEDEQAILLSAFVQDFGMGAEKKLQQDMVAHYLQCGAQEGGEQPFLVCLEQVSCAYHHPKLDIPS